MPDDAATGPGSEAYPPEWSDDGVPFRHRWPVFGAAAGGAAYTAIWLLAGEPDIHLSRWIAPACGLVGLAAAALGPRPRRVARIAAWLVAGFVAALTATLLAALARTARGDVPFGDVITVVVVDVFGLAFFGGGALWAAHLHRPGRRLAPTVLARIPPPAATRRAPLRATARLADGSRRPLVVIEGGYVAGPRAPAAGDVVDIVAVEPARRGGPARR